MINIENKKTSQFPRFLMILSVPLVLFIFLLLGFLNQIPLKVELYSLVIVFIILIIFIFFISHNAWYAFANYKNSLTDIIEKIDTFLAKNEFTIANKRKAYGDIEPFFEQNLRAIRNDYFANVATSIFPTLGILGTFTAIAISMPNFTVDSKAALENEITVLLSGVGTAFYASIYGIFLSIWWVFFEKRGVTKIYNDVSEIKAQYNDLIWKKEEIELYKILESQKRNDNFIEKIENVITPQYIKRLDDIAKSKLDLVEKLNAEFKQNEQRLTKSYVALMKLFEDAKKKQTVLLDDFTSLHESISKSSDSLANLVNNQELNSKAIKQEIYSVLSSFELVSKDLRALGEALLEKESEK